MRATKSRCIKPRNIFDRIAVVSCPALIPPLPSNPPSLRTYRDGMPGPSCGKPLSPSPPLTPPKGCLRAPASSGLQPAVGRKWKVGGGAGWRVYVNREVRNESMIDKRGQCGMTPSHSLPRALDPHPCPCSPSKPLTALFSELSPKEILGRKALPPDEAGREKRRRGVRKKRTGQGEENEYQMEREDREEGRQRDREGVRAGHTSGRPLFRGRNGEASPSTPLVLVPPSCTG